MVGQQAQGNARLVRNFLEGGFGIAKLTKQFLGRFKKSFLLLGMPPLSHTGLLLFIAWLPERTLA